MASRFSIARFSRWSAKKVIAGAVVLGVVAGAVVFSMVGFKGEPAIVPGEATIQRITSDQYRNIINDVFGPTIELGGRFEPGLRIDGLLAVGASSITMTPASMEQYDAMARIVANQVVSERYRALMIPCKPLSVTKADDACASKFLGKVGRLLYRRPLTTSQLGLYVGAARVGAENVQDFYEGLSLSLAAMLSSPQFLFRAVVLEPDPDHEGSYRLDAYSEASRLSFLLWNSGPDLPLLDAAEKGELHIKSGLKRQVDRMMASARLEQGIRAFFADHFEFSEFENLSKDAALFPKFSAQLAADAQEETLKTALDVVLTRKADYREIFTTKRTFLTPELGAIYRVPVPNEGPNGSPDKWSEFEFAANDPRGGILTQVAFTALHSPAGRSSPTLRGKGLREVLLCQKVPAPPPNVSFAIVQDTHNAIYKTARKRLAVHATQPACAGCHKLMDPIGLALENFDGAGEYQTTENGEAIDASGVIDGAPFKDAGGLSKAVFTAPAATSCLVNRLTSYALGRQVTAGEKPWMSSLQKSFADNGYRVTDLVRKIATSEAFYRARKPESRGIATEQTLAQVGDQ